MELEKRESARTSLLAFTTYTKPDYEVAGIHHRIAAALEAVDQGACRRLMIFAPPRGGKTELASRRFPAWYLGRDKRRSVISASYGQALANDIGRDVRGIIADRSYRAIFPDVAVAADSSARNRFHTTTEGQYLSVGVGGAVTGRGAQLLCLDDVLKGRAEADSEAVRNHTWAWFQSVAYTRLSAAGAIVYITTRWHPDDPAGRLLEAQKTGGDQWEIVEVSAIDDAGESYWPQRWPVDKLREIETAIGPREWSSLYLQQPVVAEGAIFKVAMIKTVPSDVTGGTAVRAWDLAATRKIGTRDPDWTVGVLMRKTVEGSFVVADVVRFRGGPEIVRQSIINVAAQDGASVRIDLPQDPGQAGKAQVADFTRALQGYKVTSSPETGDKATRAAPFASQVNVGNVSIIAAAWNRPYTEELAAFPGGAHDDMVDASSRAFGVLSPPPPQQPRLLNFGLMS